jgi:hypothetical protein
MRRKARTQVKRKFPPRTLWIVDIENLTGAAVPTLDQVEKVRKWYTLYLGLNVDDQVVIAASHLGLLNAALGWPHARYRVRSGKDGADLELLDVLEHENVAARFTHVVIGSSDKIFDHTATSLAARGVEVTVVSRSGDRLSPGLARVAGDVISFPASA